ncbi:MAG: multicopper oxidase family protein [Pseudomonadota bacterium]
MSLITRRGFLAASTATAAALVLPARVRAQSARMTLSATTRTIDVRGRAATVWGLLDAQGRSGLVLEPGQAFAVDLTNALAEPTIIHWHGQIPPNMQDGVPDIPMPVLQPGETRSYDFPARAGTHWMHAHIATHEMLLLAAPLIVRRPEDVAADRQEVTMFLHDYAFDPPDVVLKRIFSGTSMETGEAKADPGDMSGMAMGGMNMQGMDMGGMDMGGSGAAAGGGAMSMSGPGGMEMDLNDYDFDAYLANERTLYDPEVVQVEKGGRVLVRVINAAAATSFWIDTGAVQGRLVAVDGEPVQPLPGNRFGLAMGQRLDIELDLPRDGGAFPVLALREGESDRTGLILATPGATVTRIAEKGEADAPAFSADLTQEASLRALAPLPDRAPTAQPTLVLGGTMMPYAWTINGQGWGRHVPVTAKSGERVEIAFSNMSMMAHPMHLHGHAFQVVGIGANRFAGAVRDTVHVPPMTAMTIAFDAGEAARWVLHCHHMPHLESGMMTELAVSA